VLDVTGTATDGDGTSGSSRQIETVGAQESFAGAKPFAVRVQPVDEDGNPLPPIGVIKNYRDLVDGNVVSYGSSSVYSVSESTISTTVTFDPALAVPSSLEPGQTHKSTYTTRTVNQDGSGNSVEVMQTINYSLTYVGREALESPLGSFNVCHVIAAIETLDANKAVIGAGTTDSWIATEGAYRGQRLKTHSVYTDGTTSASAKSDWVATKMTYTPK